jgi:hypothetical protein
MSIASARTRSGALALLTALMTPACGSTSIEDLPQPTIWWEQSNVCSAVRAVDGNRGVWDDEAACESGGIDLEQVGVATPTDYGRVSEAAAALPETPPPPPSCSSGRYHVFGTRRDGQEKFWHACGSSSELGDLSGLSEPYLTLAQAIKALH